MQLVDDAGKKTQNAVAASPKRLSNSADQLRQIDAAISVISNVVETACERSPDLDLMRLVNFMDLYCTYLQLARDPQSEFHDRLTAISSSSDSVVNQKLQNTELVSFELFIRDSRLLNVTALAASCESGETVAPPVPLTLSAND